MGSLTTDPGWLEALEALRALPRVDFAPGWYRRVDGSAVWEAIGPHATGRWVQWSDVEAVLSRLRVQGGRQVQETKEDTVSRVDGTCDVPTTGSTAQSANGHVPTLQEIQRRDGVGVAEALRRQIAETPMCLAQEWVRDGRGLWAMRACQYFASHGKQHTFGSWRYDVQPPVGEVRS